MKLLITVSEIEHEGDFDAASEGIQLAGGTVLDTFDVNFDDETAVFVVEVPDGTDKKAFVRALEDQGVCI